MLVRSDRRRLMLAVTAIAGLILVGGALPPGTAMAQPASAAPPVAAATSAAGDVAPTPDWQRLADPRARFALANRLYQAGQFGTAAAIYTSVFDAGQVSAALYLNLGNALLRSGELGEAIVAYHRGLRLSPRDRDLRTNLIYAQSLTVDVVPESSTSIFLEHLANLARRSSVREVLLVMAGLYWASMAVFLLGRLVLRVRRPAFVAQWILLPALGLCLALAAQRVHAVYGEEVAVVLEEVVEVRSGPGIDHAARFNLHEGTAVQVRRAADDWLEIELTAELNGWVPESVLGRL